jgi:enoyl-CoA hydratase/carnithine racemase
MTERPPVLSRREGKIEILQINHEKRGNPINQAIHQSLCHELKRADADSSVSAIVLTGGARRSFSVGGDFVEVAALNTPESVQAWIERVCETYTAVLSVNKPVVMAVGGWAIGMGLQLALMGDWRVAAEDSQLTMWELEKGVACTVGACILHRCFGRLATARLIYGCEVLNAQRSLEFGLVDEVVPTAELGERAIERANQFGSYPSIPFKETKRVINAPFIAELWQNTGISGAVHAISFQAGSSAEHMKNVLKH